MKRAQKTTVARVQKEKFARQQFPQLHPKSENQKQLFEAFKQGMQIIATDGSSGSGKTFIACWHAAKRLHYGDIKKIILIRAYQPLANRSIGFLPGTAEEKLLPYYRQMLDYLEDFMGKATVEIALKNASIEICSLETIRGRSWDDSCIIVDESQNLYVEEVQALTTRIGAGSQMVFCGDNSGFQTDMKKQAMNGLAYLKFILEKYNISDSAFITFTTDDIFRSGIVKEFVLAFEAELALQHQATSIPKSKQQRKV